MAATITVRLGVGGKNEVTAKEGMTVNDALKAAGVKPRWSSKFFVNDKSATTLTVLNPGDTVTVSPRPANG